jgi:ADP-ribose pyrophosphatase YjhB (NUDIX family)
MSDGFCIQCGNVAKQEVPEGDNRLRKVCGSCDFIHYENPKNVVGCLLEWQGKVLLCKRAIEPRHGYWTLPAGFMENQESTIEGAAREAYEEATAQCDELRLFSVYNLPRISQVYLMFFGKLRNGFAKANEETLDVGLFDESEIPWDELAFPVVTETLTRYYEMREQRDRRVYCADIFSRPGAPLEIVRHPH